MKEKQFYLDFAQKEITCACYSIAIPTEDVERIRKMNKRELADYISSNDFDWNPGKEYVEDTDGFMGEAHLFSNEDGREELFDEFETLYKDQPDPSQNELPITVDESRVIDMAADVKVKVPKQREVISVGNIQVPAVMENAVTKQRLYTFVGKDNRPTLAQCQAMVEGDIEIVIIKRDTLVPVGSQLIVNKVGCMAGREPLPINPVATQLYHSTCIEGTTAKIHGHAILLADGAQLD